MKWWRAGVAVAALLLVVVAARGTSPITFSPRTDDPDQPRDGGSVSLVTPGLPELPDFVAAPFAVFLGVLVALVLFGLVGIILGIELPRWRRRRGVRGVEVADGTETRSQSVVHRVEKALQEFTEHPQRPPRDAVVAAWLALEEAQPRQPHQTPTEFTERLGVDAAILKDLYQRARFGHEDITSKQADQAKRELGRIIRELA